MLKLTKELIRDMKQARSLVVHRDSKGRGMMTLHFDDEIRGVKTSTHKSWLVDAYLKSYRCQDYETKTVYFEADPKESNCCASVSLYPTSGYHADYVLSTLKDGDEIRFEFIGNAGNSYLGKAGLHLDMFKMLIYRGEGTKAKRWEVELDSNVYPAGSPARMIRRQAWMQDIDPTSYSFQNREEKETAGV